jgi:hypothetical protein
VCRRHVILLVCLSSSERPPGQLRFRGKREIVGGFAKRDSMRAVGDAALAGVSVEAREQARIGGEYLQSSPKS